MHSSLWAFAVSLIVGVMVSGSGYAQDTGAERSLCANQLLRTCKTIAAARIDTAPEIDGVLSPGEWANAREVSDFHQILPNEFDAPGEETRVWIAYDSDYIYVGAQLDHADPEAIVARRMIHNIGVSGDDRFRIFIGPLNNARTGYLFETNANGVRQEALLEGPSRFNFDWRSIWRVRSARTETGWSTEIAIPFRSINFDPNNPNWGLGFWRQVAESGETIGWTSEDRRVNPETLGVMTGVEGANQGVGLDIVPNMNIRVENDDRTQEQKLLFEPGVDVTYNITPTLKAQLTVNTDFSTADVDDQVVNLSRFSIFLPERRDFFLQDADIFSFGGLQTNGNPFFSRRIGLNDDAEPVDLKFGGKVTGRVGDVSIGALAVVQEKGGFDAFGQPLDGDTELFVARTTLDVLDNSTVGAILTHGDPLTGEGAFTVGVDFLWRNTTLVPGRRVLGEFFYQRTDRPGLGADAAPSNAWGFQLSMPSREGLRGTVNWRVIERGFDPALGFINRTNIDNRWVFLAQDWRPDSGPIRRINMELFAETFQRRDEGDVESQLLSIRPLRIVWNAGDNGQVDLRLRRDVLQEPFEIVDGVIIPPGDYSWETVRFFFETAPQRPVFFSGRFQSGSFYTGDRTRFDITGNWRPNKYARLSLTYTQNDVDLPEGQFISRLMSLRTDIAFTPQFNWITRVQYDNISQTGNVNSRLSYEIEPGRNVFLVFNQGAERLEFEDHRSQLNFTDSDLTLRVAYTFRF